MPPQVRSRQRDVAATAMDGFRRIVRALRVSSRAIENAVGLSSAQLFVLQQLADRPAESLRELAQRTLTDPSSVSVVVGRLVASGLVRRHASASDARRVTLALTPAGRLAIVRSPQPAQVRLAAALEEIPPRRLLAFARTLDHLARRTDPSGEPPAMFFEERANARRRSDG